MKTVTITQQQWRELNAGLLFQMAETLHTEHGEYSTREERISEYNDLEDARFQILKINEAFKA